MLDSAAGEGSSTEYIPPPSQKGQNAKATSHKERQVSEQEWFDLSVKSFN